MLVLWHVRVGDITINIPERVFRRVRRSIDSALPSGRVHRHVVVSEKSVHAKFPFLRGLGFDAFETSWEERDAIRALASADVLVNTGARSAQVVVFQTTGPATALPPLTFPPLLRT